MERPGRFRFQFSLKSLVGAQLIIGIGIPMVWVATQSWLTNEWWRMFAFDGVILILVVLTHLIESVCGKRFD